MNGERLPLDWITKLRLSLHHPNSYSLLDVAALVSTTPIDLSNHLFAPDFITLSFYKIFGFPDLGALIVQKSAGHVFDKRKYFGGGTTEMTTCIKESWVVRKESSFEVCHNNSPPSIWWARGGLETCQLACQNPTQALGEHGS